MVKRKKGKSLELVFVLLLSSFCLSKAELVDFTCVNENPVTSAATPNNVIAGYKGNHALITSQVLFGRTFLTGTGKNVPECPCLISVSGQQSLVTRQEMRCPSDSCTCNDVDSTCKYRIGAFFCRMGWQTPTVIITTVTLNSDAVIKQKRQTITVSVGDSVTLSVTTTASPLIWKKNTDIKTGIWADEKSPQINNVALSDAGLYECHVKLQRGQGKHAIFRLIVRGCSANMWRKSTGCHGVCPVCYNGGMCDDLTGECICAPGFSGSNCHLVHGRNVFGSSGTLKCNEIEGRHGTSCRGRLFCLQDPFGCVCAAGYKGIDCTQECDQLNAFGPYCLQICHCADTITCLKDTGECYNSSCTSNNCPQHCAEGWKGQNCQVQTPCPVGLYGELCNERCNCSHNQPCNEETGECDRTNDCADNGPTCSPGGAISIVNFRQINKPNAGQIVTVECVASGNPVPASHHITVVDSQGNPLTLRSTQGSFDNDYSIIIKYDLTGDGSRDGAQLTCRVRGSTQLGLELIVDVFEPPYLVSAPFLSAVTPTSIIVTWQPWSSSQGHGDGPVLRYEVHYRLKSDVDTKYTNVTSTSTSLVVTGLVPDMKYDFVVVVVREGPGGSGASSPTATIRTTCKAPTAPPTINVSTQNASQLRLTWELPVESTWQCKSLQGIQVHIKKQSQSSFDASTHNISATPLILGSLEACTRYVVYVTFTNRDGVISPTSAVVRATTSIAAPGPVHELSMSGTSYDNLNVRWSAPTGNNCPVDSYIISHTLVRLFACDSVPSTLSTTMSQTVNSPITTVTLNNLKANARYKVSVVAVNEAGSSPEGVASNNTGKTAPSFIPTVTVPQSDIRSSSIRFTWTELPCEQRSGVFRHYRTLLTNQAMSERSPSNVNSLEKTQLAACTRYSFQVAVVNNIGAGSYSNVTDVTTTAAVPGRVNQLTATGLNGYPTILQIRWTRPWGNCPIQNYTISYSLINTRTVPCERVATNTIVSGTTTGTSYNITGLVPYSTYDVDVTATTTAGKGHQASTNTGQTAEAAPSKSPQSVNVWETLKKGLSFSWESPKCLGRRGVITGYSYTLEDQERNLENTGNTSSSETSIKLKDLVPYTWYSFKVRARTAAGVGPYSNAIRTQTGQAKPPPVSFVTTPSADASSITVQWQRPDPPHGIITAYYVVYFIVGQESDRATNKIAEGLNQTVLTLKLTGLEADSNYSIQVQAETVNVGELSQPVYRITQEGIPGKPSTLVISNKGEREISITWNVPTQTNGIIVSYTVKHRVVHRPYDSDFTASSEYVTPLLLEPNIRSTTITGLDPGTKYEILVSASTRKGEGAGARIDAFTDPASDIPSPQKPTMDPKMSTETSAVISIPEVDSRFVVSYLVTVKMMSTRRRRQSMLGVQDQKFGSFNETPEAYIAGEIDKRDHKGRFEIGNNHTYGGYYNAPLREGTSYEVRSGASSKTDGAPLVSWSEPLTFKAGRIQERLPPDQGDNLGGSSSAGTVVGVIIALFVCFIVVIGAAIIVKKRRNQMTGQRFESVGMSKLEVSKYNEDTPSAAELKHAASEDALANLNAGTSEDGAAPSKSPGAATLPADLHKKPTVKAKKMTLSGPIKVEKLAAYVKSKKANNNGGYKQDYGSLPNDLCHPWEVARKDENKAKNRYGNIIAYDHSRVVLEKLEGDPHSDYVNASYIDGYKQPKRYIASQGPNIASMVDMWRMIWQEQTHVIVMVTHLVEGGKKKCEQYWPSKTKKYGVIEVTLEAEAKHADYIVRNFNLRKGEECRQLDQYHFISWPDMGLPQCSGPLLNFIDIVKEGYTKFPDMGPVIVHCSAGVGRTGSFITIDSMLDKAKAEGQVDIFQFVSDMRERRVRMVQTLDQYVFIFDVLLEAFLCGQTGIRVEELGQAVSKLKAPGAKGKGSLMDEEFAKLALVQPSPQKGERFRGAKDPQNVDKNRFQDNLPLDRGRPYLMTMGTEQSTNYINASFMNGYWKRDQYIITQIPMPNTTTDFWSMIHDYKSSTIIMLNPLDPNDETMDKYWPEKTTCAYGPFNVQLTETESYDSTVCRTLMLDNMNKPKDDACTIKQFEFQDWPIGADVPSSIAALLKMINNVERWLEEASEGPVTIQCLDGVQCSGVFCAILFMLDRMKTEKVVDVFQTVRSIRTNRPSAVSSVEQYKLCYETAKMHLDSFDIYENFK